MVNGSIAALTRQCRQDIARKGSLYLPVSPVGVRGFSGSALPLRNLVSEVDRPRRQAYIDNFA